MSGFTLFRRGECPICNGNTKGCRQSDTTDLIFCRDTSANPSGYLYRGEDSWGFGLWQLSSDADAFSQEAKEERQRRRQEFLVAEERRRQEQIARQLPAVERHKWYSKLLERLTLASDDQQKLLSRGFTQEQIVIDGYKSLSSWQKVGKDFPANLAGLLSNGALNVAQNGILCPIRNKDGLIVGCQVRLHESTDGRYRWLTSATKKNPDGPTPHLNGELPLGVFEPEQFAGDSIWLTEGTAIKPSLTRYRLGVPVVGASSGRFNGSPEAAAAAVDYLTTKYQTKTLTFAVDAGDVLNSSGVPERWKQQFEFFTTRGYECRVAWWGQIQKSADDVDELVDTSIIQQITVDEFWQIVQDNQNALPEEKKANEDSDWAWENWLKSRKFTPHRVIDQQDFSFGNLPDSGVIVAGKSGLGTKKTIKMIEVMKASSKGAFLLGYRNNLLYQTGSRAQEFGLSLYHLREDGGIEFISDDWTSIMLCLDSIFHVDGYFKRKDLYIDETVSVLLHAVNGGTLGDMQAKALKILTKALEECDRVFLLDGNLADIYVDFVAKLATNKRVIKIENKRKIAPHTIKIIEGIDEEQEIKQRDRSPLIQLMLQPDVIPWIYCDSKERANILYKILTDLGRRGFVLSSETSGEDWAKKLLADPDKYIRETKPEFAITTPTGESGISATIRGHFTHKLSFFVGVAGTNSQHQAMFRLRDDSVPHYVFCPERSNVRDRANPNSYSVKKFKEILDDRIIQSAVLAGQASANPERVLEVIGAAIARQQDDWWEFSCKLGVIDNYEMNNLRRCLIHALEEAGHNVEVLQWSIDGNIKQLEKATKEAVQRQHAREVYAAAEFSSIEEAREKAKSSPKKETQRRIEKTFLLDRLSGIKESPVWTEEFVYECHIKNKEFINQQQRFYMVNNFDVSQKRHESSWFYQATSEDFFSARVKRMSHDIIWALRELNITQFIGREYHKNSPEVVNFINTLRERKDVQLALRKYHLKPETSNGKERLEILGDVLNLIGFKNLSTGQKFVDNIRLRHYKAEPTVVKPGGIRIIRDDEPEFDLAAARLAILEAIERKFTAWMQSEKSQVNWEPEPTQAEVQTTVQTTVETVGFTPETLAEVLTDTVTTREMYQDILACNDSSLIDAALLLVSSEVRDRIDSFTVEDSRHEVAEIESATILVDEEIRRTSPLCDLDQLPLPELWTRRLSRAVLMTQETARAIYTRLPQQILNEVWERLSYGVQSHYAQIFAA